MSFIDRFNFATIFQPFRVLRSFVWLPPIFVMVGNIVIFNASLDAKYNDKHWSFEPLPAKIEIPKSAMDDQFPGAPLIRNPIDRFIHSKLTIEKQTFQPIADRAILARRASLVLTGRLPDSAMVQQFVQSDDARAYEAYVDSLLASPQFGERVAMNWLKLSQYAETQGDQSDQYCDGWPYRDWVVSAINQDLPYDQFVTWQLAGDMLAHPTDSQRLATAFNWLQRQMDKGGGVEEELRVRDMTARVDALGKAVMGLTFQCSRCHDHKHDPFTQREYFQLCDMFDNISTQNTRMLLLNQAQKQQLKTLQDAMQSVRQVYADDLRKLESSPTVENWYSSLGAWPQPQNEWLKAEFNLDKTHTEPASLLANNVHANEPGGYEGTIQWKMDNKHSAILLDGDNALIFPKTGVFSRTQEFTICFELKLPTSFDRAMVLHRSMSRTDAGSRGYQLSIESGHFHFDIIHYWPSSAIRVRCTQPVPQNKWMHIALVYGGTNLAEDTHIYVDGNRAPVEILRNTLQKDILDEGDEVVLSIGARDGDQGLAGGLVDNLQVYDSALTAIEIAGLATDQPWVTWFELTSAQQTLWRGHYAQRIDPQFKYHKESYLHYFNSLAELVQPAREILVMSELSENRPTRVLNRGSFESPGELVESGVHRALLTDGEPMPRNRLELARWLTSDHHPLTARVAVNHIWQQLFGRGLVVTAEDFGVHGQSPTHPELLDFLARELIRSGWSRKKIFRMIATSQAFMQSSQISAASSTDKGGDSDKLGHYPAHRLTAELLRAGAFQAGGLRSERLGAAANLPGSELCPANRDTTATSLQSLEFTNDPQNFEASRAIALLAIGINKNSEITAESFDPTNIAQALKRVVLDLTSLDCSDSQLLRLMLGYQEQVKRFEQEPERADELLNIGQWKAIESSDANLRCKLAAMTFIVNSILNTEGFTVIR